MEPDQLKCVSAALVILCRLVAMTVDIFAIAFATTIAHAEDLQMFVCDQGLARRHMYHCFTEITISWQEKSGTMVL